MALSFDKGNKYRLKTAMKKIPHHASFFLDYFDGIGRNEIFCTKFGLHSAYENSTFFSGAYFAACQAEKAQLQNKEIAMQMIRAKYVSLRGNPFLEYLG